MYKDFIKSFFWLPSLVYLLLYWQTLSFGAAFPDDTYVLNPLAKDFELMLKTFYDNSSLPGFHFTPFFIFQCFLVNSIFGENAYPFGFHLYKLIMHSIGCLLATMLIYRITASRLISVLVVTFWTIHPMNVQILTRLLCAPGFGAFACCLGFLLCYLKIREIKNLSTKIFLLFFGNILFLFSIMTVEFFFLFPFILYLVFFYLDGSKIFKNKSYLYLLLPLAIYPIYLVLRYFACGGTLYETSDELVKWTEVGTLRDILFRTFWLSPQLFVHYFKLFLFPDSPIDSRAEWYIVGDSAWSLYSLFCQILVLTLVIVCIFFYKKIPLFTLGMGWFFFCILSTLQIFPLFSIVGVRWLYVSSLGLSLALFSLLAYLLKFVSKRNFVLLLLPVFSFFLWKTLYYIPSSKDAMTQYIFMAKEAPPFIKVFYMNLVQQKAYSFNGKKDIPSWINDKTIDDEVNKWLENYLNLQPNLSHRFGPIQMAYNYNLYRLLCKYLYDRGKINELRILIDQVVKVKNDSYGWLQLANFLRDVKQWQPAWDASKKAIELNPKLDYLYSWPFIESAKNANKFSEAEQFVRNYLALKPKSARPYLFAGIFYAAFDKAQDALNYFKAGIASDKVICPGSKSWYLAIADIFMDYRMANDAKDVLKVVISFDPFNTEARKKLIQVENLIHSIKTND